MSRRVYNLPPAASTSGRLFLQKLLQQHLCEDALKELESFGHQKTFSQKIVKK